MKDKNPMLKLQTIRLQKGMTQRELAKKTGLHLMAISYYERGLRNPNSEVLKRIASALECSLDELVQPDKIKGEFEGLELAAKSLVDWRKKNLHPHATIVIMEEGVKIVEDLMFFPVGINLRDDNDVACPR